MLSDLFLFVFLLIFLSSFTKPQAFSSGVSTVTCHHDIKEKKQVLE